MEVECYYIETMKKLNFLRNILLDMSTTLCNVFLIMENFRLLLYIVLYWDKYLHIYTQHILIWAYFM